MGAMLARRAQRASKHAQLAPRMPTASGLSIFSNTKRIGTRSTPEFGLLFSAEGYCDGPESPLKNRTDATPS